MPEVGRRVKAALGAGSVIGAAVIGAIGFYLSFGNLSTAGHEVFGFPQGDARYFAVGVDAAIITCLVLDLFMAAIRTSWPLLRLLAHGMTVASVYFNAAAHGPVTENWDVAVAHGLMPVLFVIGTEAGRRILVHQAALPADHDVIPGHRWLLSPRPTWSIFRTMRLWELGYTQAMARSRERAVFDAWQDYKTEVTAAGLEAGSEEALARLPRKLAPYGLTVDQALALPDEMARQEQHRRQEAERRARALTRDQERAAGEAERERQRDAHEAELERLAQRQEESAMQARAAAAERVAQAEGRGAVAQAEARTQAVERAALLEGEAEESAAQAQARARQAAAQRQEADDRQAAAETDRAAAEAEQDAAEARRRTAEADAGAQAAAARREQAAAAAAKAEQDTAEARQRAAEAELRTVEAEDALKLSPKARSVRRVARMILADTGGDADQLPLERVAEACGVSTGTASDYRRQAADLITDGYRGPAEVPA